MQVFSEQCTQVTTEFSKISLRIREIENVFKGPRLPDEFVAKKIRAIQDLER
jgi:DNA repair REX1-B